jgi:deoxyribodipyrimidine photo-lyase
MKTAIVLFTRDLRVHDNPVLAAAGRAAEHVIPVFVHDPKLDPGRNRAQFLGECLADLRGSLRDRGGDLVELRGDPVHEVMRLAKEHDAEGIGVAADVSAYAQARQRRLAEACETERIALKVFASLTIVPPGELVPASGNHYKVFTPYWRAWEATKWRDVEAPPPSVRLPAGLQLPPYTGSQGGGETAARRRLAQWVRELAGYADGHDDLPGDQTSRLSPYLHFGCVSAREVAARVAGKEGAEPFVRQLCWRDFYHQVLNAFPELRRRAYRASAEDKWRTDQHALDAWKEGQTGVPVVDAGMRQLAQEGWMHNRARLLTASYLTKHLHLDWRAGGDHFFELLLDGDVANNYGNWQWVAGTGNDTKPYRRFNPTRQAERFDPDGVYVRRYVPELAGIEGKAIHEPWKLPDGVRRKLRYPEPLQLP